MFNHKYEIRPAFYLDPAALRRRFQLCGMAHIVLMPFLLFFVTIYFGLQNAYDWKSTKKYLGPREWSMPAKWTFREFNELQHLFERRMAPSYKAAETYMDLFGTSEVVAAVGRILVFVGGSLGAVLFAFAAINDAILLHVKIGDWNLLWYAGVFGVVYSVGKALIPNAKAQPKSAHNLYEEMDTALADVASNTHYYPDVWKGRGWEHVTYTSFSSMYKYKAKLFATEVVSLIFAPYILCVSLAKCAEPICEFVVATKAEIRGGGEVCGYATFDFEKFCDETWHGRTLGEVDPMTGSLAESIMEMGNVDEARRKFPTPKSRCGKMEKSFFSFKGAHSSWTCSPSGQSLVNQMERAEQDAVAAVAALSREQELHRQAAVRQLETLERIEESNRESDDNVAHQLHESYIPNQAPADAGAGTRRTD
jgi:autophagy-related protein 9